ncbi:MAG: T9SS type A sorting domain-containing protein [Ignavibacteriales bacterium]|nr:MAG: T9SS type A sorting domain-containing protein [Ignavibacteriaceae bacterium]MBW7871937.1 T9SS type A sorting domain-containing protein [Ignavibacteria bacterium]MCZ2144212.1 T9SS type A sorting domain-containing protein [Ignavibacteriales bacterium]OQY79009.1 MAG: hypothetical protein B6D45_01580 [Ignavibacteriales bacterium UTCHB3]MBV6446166.1 hypothetical protein [Ignavibacteriaceae bacterium]
MRKLSTLLILLVVAGATTFGQMQYKFSANDGAYTSVVGGNQFTWTGSADEGYTGAEAIGFAFTYNGEAVDSFQVSTNGFLRFGTSLGSATLSNALNGLTRGVVAPFWDDLKAADQSNITYSVSGAAPNRVLTVQWDSMHVTWSNATPNAQFQVKLYETTNVIEFVYGQSVAPTGTPTASIGLSSRLTLLAANQGTGEFLSINPAGQPFNRSWHQSMGSEYNGILVFPDSGTVLKFTPNTITPMSGNYTVNEIGGDFKTVSEAAMALNMNGISGPVTITINSGTYDDVFHLINVAGTSAANTILVKGTGVTLSPRNGSYATAAPSATAGDAIIRLEGSQYVTIDGTDGFFLVDNMDNILTKTKFNMGVLLRNSVKPVGGVAVFQGAKFNTIKNVDIDLRSQEGAANTGAIGVRIGTAGSAATDTLAANSYNTIGGCNITGYWRAAVQMYGFNGNTNPDIGNKIIGKNGYRYSNFGSINIASGASNDVRTIEMNAEKDPVIEGVIIEDVNASVMTTNSVYAIRLNAANSATDHVSGNIIIRDVKIDHIYNNGAGTTTGLAVGMDIQQLGANSTLLIDKCEIKNIRSYGSGTGRAFGLQLNNGSAGGTGVTTTIQNSYIYSLSAPRSTASTNATGPGVQGMNLQATAGAVTYNVYFNTVLLDGNTVPEIAAVHSTDIYWGNFGNGVLDLRNNILVNRTDGGTGRASVLYASAATNFAKLAATTNNNLLYADTALTNPVIAYDGATEYATFAAYQAAVSPKDSLSVTELVPIMGWTPEVMPRIDITQLTQASHGGAPIAGITTDFWGNPRNASTPDIGAEEFTAEVPAPSNLMATSQHPEYVQLTWTDNSPSEDGFIIERKTGDSTSAAPWDHTVLVIANATSYRDSSVLPTTTYTYRIKAFQGLVSSDYSNLAQVVTVIPVQLSSFTATADKNTVQLAWATATETNADQFIVQRKSGSDDWAEVGTVKASGTSTTTKNYTFTERNLAAGKYSYRLKQVDFDGTFELFDAVEVEVGTPTVFDLSQNYPNPFNPATRIEFSIPTPTNVTLEVYDISGQVVATLVSGYMNAGYHFVDFDAAKYHLASGTYIYRLSADKFTSIKKMILVK